MVRKMIKIVRTNRRGAMRIIAALPIPPLLDGRPTIREVEY